VNFCSPPRRVGQERFRYAEEAARDASRLGDRHRRQRLAGIGKDRHGRASTEPVGWPPLHRQQRGARRRVEPGAGRGVGGAEGDEAEVDRGQVRAARFGGQRRHAARVDHHDARPEPHHQQQAQRDAEIAVRQDEPLAHDSHARILQKIV
jgi:hypothetical protein